MPSNFKKKCYYLNDSGDNLYTCSCTGSPLVENCIKFCPKNCPKYLSKKEYKKQQQSIMDEEFSNIKLEVEDL